MSVSELLSKIDSKLSKSIDGVCNVYDEFIDYQRLLAQVKQYISHTVAADTELIKECYSSKEMRSIYGHIGSYVYHIDRYDLSFNLSNMEDFKNDIFKSFITLTFDPKRFPYISNVSEEQQKSYLKESLINSLLMVFEKEALERMYILMCYEHHNSGIIHSHILINVECAYLGANPYYSRKHKKHICHPVKDGVIYNLKRHLAFDHRNLHCVNIRPIEDYNKALDYLRKDNDYQFISFKPMGFYSIEDEDNDDSGEISFMKKSLKKCLEICI